MTVSCGYEHEDPTSMSVFGDGRISTHVDPTSTRSAIMCSGAEG